MRFKRNKNRFGAPRNPVGVPARQAGQPHKGVYLLPNLFTTAALFCGFYGIVQAMGQQFGTAAVAIFAAMVLDSLDGRVARMTNTQSAFGEQMDSLSDMVSFGAAPALIVYEWALKGMGKAGWVAAFVYCSCAALRLARFNTNLTVVDKRYFQGLPSPAAAAVVMGFIWVMNDAGYQQSDMHGWLAGLAMALKPRRFRASVASATASSGENAIGRSGRALDQRSAAPSANSALSARASCAVRACARNWKGDAFGVAGR